MTTDMAIVDQPTQMPTVRHADRHAAIMSTSSADLPAKLAEFNERRRLLREWMLGSMEQGVHYGIVPGTEGKGGARPEQYRKLPSLYQPGADLIVELMGVRAEFEPDAVAWQQLGSKLGTVCYKCRLFSRDGELLGEGNGADRVGNKQRDENSAIKMACKRAKVAAVIMTYSLSDLFSQDLEDLQREPHANPEPSPDAPRVQPRGDRVNADECKALFLAWKADAAAREESASAADFELWASQVTGMAQALVASPTNWTRANLEKCMAELKAGAK